MMLSAPRQAVLLAGGVAFRSTDGMDEDWRPVVGYEGRYEVSDLGRVRSVEHRDRRGVRRPGIILRLQRDSDGYRIAGLSRDGRVRSRKVARLVLAAFVGSAPERAEACHNNGDRQDNRLENLRWDSTKANAADRDRHGRTARGARSAVAKLTPARARFVRDLIWFGATRASAARVVGLNWSTVARLASGRTWTHEAWPEPDESVRPIAERISSADSRRRAAVRSLRGGPSQ